jgi:hypothetical protein
MSVYVHQALRGGIVDRSLPSSATAIFPAPCQASTALGGLPAGTPVAFEAAYGWGWLPANLGQFVPRGKGFGMVRAVKLQPAMRLTKVELCFQETALGPQSDGSL